MNAINILKFTPKKSAKILFKVVKSALANAKNNVELDENNLYISKIEIGR
jgi:large subunit ribosomal protein L22